jgi:two-component system sensor histidine kinase UhpB
MSLRLRLNLLIALIMILFLIGLSITLMKSSKKAIEEGVESSHRVSLQLLDTFITSSVQNPEWGYTHQVIQPFLVELGHVRSNIISLYDLNNHLLYQSPTSTYRQEITPPAWFKNYMTPPQEINAKIIKYGRLIVQSDPDGAIREAWYHTRSFIYISLIVFLLINIFIYMLLGRWLSSINPLLKGIEDFGRGNLKTRLPKFDVPDFQRIATNFNKMGQSLEKFLNENKKLALISQQTADAIMILDSDRKINFWNHSAENMFGFRKKEVLGKSVELIVPKNKLGELKSNLSYTHKNKKIQNLETRRLTKSKKMIDVSISISPLFDPDKKEVIGDIVSMRDISEKLTAEKSKKALDQNRKLTGIIRERIEDERRSLARELHDELGQYVSAIKIFTQNIKNQAKGNELIATSAESVTSAANQIYDGMHNIIRKLRPGSLDNLGLVETINDLVGVWQKQYPAIKVIFKHNKVENLSEEISINIYRIIQEGMNNCLKHADASEVKIDLMANKRFLKLTFSDNGKGFDTNILKASKQFGIVGMRERIQGLGGKFELQSDQNGTIITGLIPAKKR